MSLSLIKSSYWHCLFAALGLLFSALRAESASPPLLVGLEGSWSPTLLGSSARSPLYLGTPVFDAGSAKARNATFRDDVTMLVAAVSLAVPCFEV